MKLSRIEDADEARDIYRLAFPADYWPGDDHTFWVAREGKEIAGLCSALYAEQMKLVYLSRAAVAWKFQGLGLQRRMIRERVKWGMEQGATVAWTYTLLRNHASIINLIREGFVFDQTPRTAYHCFYLPLPGFVPATGVRVLDEAWRAF